MSKLGKVKVSEIKEGDIVILEMMEGDWISKAISLLTRSKVTHATISLGLLPDKEHDGVGYVAEETAPHAIYNSLLDRTERVAYVMRKQPVITDIKPVMKIVDYYVANEWPYASAAQPFLGMYFLVKDISDSLHLRKIGEKLMKLTMGIMIEMLNQVFHDGKSPMMCSQFAYHCYHEAGKEYEIKLKKNQKSSILHKVCDQILSDYDHYKEVLDKETDLADYISRDDNVDYEEVVKALCETLEKQPDTDTIEVEEKTGKNNDYEDTFIVTVFQYVKLFYQVFIANDEERKQVISPKDLLLKFEDMQEYFVTPEDLLHNTENLECMGTVDYEGYHI